MLGAKMKKHIIVIICIAIVCFGSLSAQNAFIVQQHGTFNVLALDNDGNVTPNVLVSSIPKTFNFSKSELSDNTMSEKPLTYSRYVYHRLDGSVYESTDLKAWNRHRKCRESESRSRKQL
jgi:hypothetical protein